MSLNYIDPSLDPRDAKWGPIRQAPLHQLVGKPIAWGHSPFGLAEDALVGILEMVTSTQEYIAAEVTLGGIGSESVNGPHLTHGSITVSMNIPKHTDTWIGYWPETLS